MADLFEVKRTSSHPALIGLTENGIERLHHADTEIACRNHEKYTVLEALDIVIRDAELLQQQRSI